MKKIVSAFLTIKEKLAKRIEQWHMVAVFFIVYDVAVVVGAYFLALWLRFDCRYSAIPYEYLSAWMMFSPIYAVVSVLVFYKFHLYQSIWRFVSFIELEKITASSVISLFFLSCAINAIFIYISSIRFFRSTLSHSFSCQYCTTFSDKKQPSFFEKKEGKKALLALAIELSVYGNPMPPLH